MSLLRNLTRSLRPSMVDFHVEGITDQKITGWAWQPSRPQTPTIIEVLSDHEVLNVVKANGFREDLAGAGKRRGYCAFEASLPRELGTTGGQKLQLRARGNRKPFFEAQMPRHALAKSSPTGPEFKIESIDRNEIRGWAWYPFLSEDPLVLEVLIEGQVIEVVSADHHREDLQALGKGDGRCSFEAHIPSESWNGHKELSAELRVQGAPESFCRIKLLNSPQAAEEGDNLDFSVDEIGDASICGWAWIPSRPAEPADIELVADGQVIGRAQADGYRKDLATAGKRQGKCAFALHYPDHIRDARPHALHLRIRGTTEPFYTVPTKPFGRLRHRLSSFGMSGIEGRASIEGVLGARVDVRITINGCEVYSCQTDYRNSFHWKGWYASSPEDSVDLGLANRLILSLYLNECVIEEREFNVLVSTSGALRVAVDELNQAGFSGLILSPIHLETSPQAFLYLDGDAIDVQDLPENCFFDFDLQNHALEDGEYVLSLGVGGQVTDRVLHRYEYKRFTGHLDICEGVISGEIMDAWGTTKETGIEMLIDDKPVGQEVAKRALSAHRGKHLFSVPIAQQWMDGNPHIAKVRILGTQNILPDRPVMFCAENVEEDVCIRVELTRGNGLSGFVFSRLRPELRAKVLCYLDGHLEAEQIADQPHPYLRATGLVPVNRGFFFNRLANSWNGCTLTFEIGEKTVRKELSGLHIDTSFCHEDACVGRTGNCFVIPAQPWDVAHQEDARLILLAAAELANAAPLTVAFCSEIGGCQLCGNVIRELLENLIGGTNAAKLKGATFVAVPEPIIPTTAAGSQAQAYKVELWVRANSFTRVISSARNGLLAYCGTTRRQGIALESTEIVILVDSLSVVSRLANQRVLDDPVLLFDETLERMAADTADRIIVPNKFMVQQLEAAELGDPTKASIASAAIEGIREIYEPLDGQALKWIVFLGPYQVRFGIKATCHAIEKLLSRDTTDEYKLGIVFLGPDDLIDGRPSSEYLYQRTAEWKAQCKIYSDLTWDGYTRLIRSVASNAVYLRLPQAEGTVWHALARAARLQEVHVDPALSDNTTYLANRLEFAISTIGEDSEQSEASSLAQMICSKQAGLPSQNERLDKDSRDPLPMVSVCISHFNRPSYLRQTLASLEACKYPNLEIIVVDDESCLPGVSEELTEIQTWLSSRNGRIVKSENRYLGAARNTGVKNAKGSLIVFMDDDNLAHRDMVSSYVTTHQRTGADIVTARFGFFDGGDVIEPNLSVPQRIGLPLGPDLAAGTLTNCFGDANMLITKAAFQQVGGFTEDYGTTHEDWELMARASTLGLRHELANKPLFWYRVAPSSMLRSHVTPDVNLLRNIRAYSHILPPQLHRVLLLTQGLVQRWDRERLPTNPMARTNLHSVSRRAFGRVSVIMRTKDRPLLLERAIESVLKQTYTNWVLIIINDGGNPDSVLPLLCEREIRLKGRFLVINHHESTGMQNASNAGIVNSLSEFIVIHDDDDSWEDSFLEKCIERIDAEPPDVAGVVTHSTVIVEEIQEDKIIEKSRFLFKNLENLSISELSIENQFPPISFLFKREAAQQIGLFNEEFSVLGDWDFHFRVAQHYPIAVIPQCLANYHHRVECTADVYGNSVVAQKDKHRIFRTELLNKRIRSAIDEGRLEESQLLYMGDRFGSLSTQIKDLKDHMFWLQKLLEDRGKHMDYLQELILKTGNLQTQNE